LGAGQRRWIESAGTVGGCQRRQPTCRNAESLDEVP